MAFPAEADAVSRSPYLNAVDYDSQCPSHRNEGRKRKLHGLLVQVRGRGLDICAGRRGLAGLGRGGAAAISRPTGATKSPAALFNLNPVHSWSVYNGQGLASGLDPFILGLFVHVFNTYGCFVSTPEEGIGFYRTTVRLYGIMSWGLNSGPLEGQSLLLPAKPSVLV